MTSPKILVQNGIDMAGVRRLACTILTVSLAFSLCAIMWIYSSSQNTTVPALVLVRPAYAYPNTGDNNVRIISHHGWFDCRGLYHVSGEVQNIGNDALKVTVTATFYDKKGNEIVTHSTSDNSYSVILNVLLPGRKTPFDIVANPPGMGNVRLASLITTRSASSMKKQRAFQSV